MCSEATVKYKHGVSSGYVMKQYYCESVYLLEYLLKFFFKSVYIIFSTFILNCFGVH